LGKRESNTTSLKKGGKNIQTSGGGTQTVGRGGKRGTGENTRGRKRGYSHTTGIRNIEKKGGSFVCKKRGKKIRTKQGLKIWPLKKDS